MLAGKWQPASSTTFGEEGLRPSRNAKHFMSANLEELESQHIEPAAPSEDLDSVTKAEVRTLVNRYCFGYQHHIAIKDFEALIKAARKHR
jgi:hypothetical protein